MHICTRWYLLVSFQIWEELDSLYNVLEDQLALPEGLLFLMFSGEPDLWLCSSVAHLCCLPWSEAFGNILCFCH